MAPWRAWQLLQRTVRGFSGEGGTRLAAAIAYYVLLSLFPLVIALVAGAGLVPGVGGREEIVDRVVDALPLTAEGADDLRGALLDAGSSAGAVGVVGLVGLLWTASGMMGAIRTGLTAVTGGEAPRPFLVGKLVDVTMVALVGLVLLASAALTVTMRVADQRVLDPLGLPDAAGAALGVLAPLLLAFGVLIGLLRLVPAEPVPWAGAWRGAVGGAVALWALATGFAVYVENFSRYNAIYGSLGAVAAFLVFVFLAAIVLLLTAAAAAAWPEVARMRRAPEPDPYGRPAGERIRRALAGLVLRR